MDTSPTTTQQSPELTQPVTSWGLANQLDAAFNRTTDRFVNFALTTLLCFLLAILVGAVCVIAVVGITIMFSAVKNSALLVMIVALVALLIYIAIIAAFSSLFGLVFAYVIIADKKVGPIQAFNHVKGLLLEYAWISFLFGLFIFGLLIWGVLSLGIVLVVWGIWATFLPIVYLKLRRKGLENVWYSKAMVSQRFWGVFGRLVFINVAFGIVIAILGSISEKYPLMVVFIMIFYAFAIPFIMSFSYEVFRGLTIPAEGTVKKPTVWIALSIIGWIFLFLALFGTIAAGSFMIRDLQEGLQDKIMQKDTNQIQMMDYPIEEVDENTDPMLEGNSEPNEENIIEEESPVETEEVPTEAEDQTNKESPKRFQ